MSAARTRVLRAFVTTALGAALALGAAPQAPDGGEAFAARLARGRESLAAGKLEDARRHLGEAWVLAPGERELAGLWLEACADRPDERALWARRWLLDGLDAAGKPRGDATLRKRCDELAPLAGETARARAAALAELLELSTARDKQAKRAPGAALVARWARERAAALARDLPSRADALPTLALELPPKLPGEALTAVERAGSSALAQGRAGDAVRAARILRGLAVQGGFDDLQGDKPAGLARLTEKANEALGRARERLTASLGEPLTVEQLYDMDEDAARAFTAAHADMANPGLAVTPRGWYRVETCCGWETLLGVAETLELHHERLARWYGEDPFVGRAGLVRVVPEAAGLEAEGAPFWWAGGFQGGDTTTMRFSCGNVEGLGHGLTHELTHRFDGALFPGQPAWLAEGKAVWTGGSYGDSGDAEFVARHVDFGAVEGAWIKGYGGAEKLRELVTGELEDYRDNYVAGYALYVFLKLGKDSGAPDYAGRLEEFMRGCAKHGKDPLGWFEACFVDGEGGRPAAFEDFAKGFEAFGRGFYWDDRAAWTSAYVAAVPQSGGDWVYDEPTWTWSRARAEPYWGQDHAWRAGELLADLGKLEDAARAFTWSAALDERSPLREERMADAFAAAGDDDAAWVLRRAGARGDEPCPLRLPKTDALRAALAAEAAGHAAAGRALCAAAAWAELAELDHALGRTTSAPAPPEAGRAPAVDAPEERLGRAGWVEDGLTGYEERRAAGCWYVEDGGDLHVGRFRPRDSSGALDRAAHNRHAFTRTVAEEPPGRYLVRCRVQFTTSYVSGALILGDTRRDRNLRLSFSAGDFYYAIGKKDQPDVLDGVSWRLDGLRERDGPLSGSLPGGRVEFDEPRTNFELCVVVDGGAAHVWIEGRYVGTYHTVDGAPIAGAIGFATGTGALRVIDPRVRRLDHAAALGLDCTPHADGTEAVRALDLARPARGAFGEFLNQRVRGARPDLRGSLLLWTPLPAHEAGEREAELDRARDKAAELARLGCDLLDREEAALPVLLAVPDALGAARLTSLRTELAPLGERVRVAPYAWAPESGEDLEEDPGAGKAWIGFLDCAGVLRRLERAYGFTDKLTPEMRHWVTVFKDHARAR